ncbi:MAG TPA: molybdenum cofactor biosynthesis protein MoaE [Phycisphaerales bacterium]|nr:molybdenum cofactor biosynthesis protein MoaE [Phycisphaerales bacterium]
MMPISIQITDGPLATHTPERPQPEGGAAVVFEGIVRPTENGATIDGLHYETYEPMAQRQMHTIAADLIQRLGLLRVSVEHSRGFVPVGGCSFRLVIVSAHRREALDAMDEFIDRLKRDVPIWKRPAPTP